MEDNNDKSGKPDCSEYLEILHLMLDGEATPEQEAFLRAHVEKCVGCLQTYQIEKEIRSLIKTKLIMQPVPVDLALSIRKKIFDSA